MPDPDRRPSTSDYKKTQRNCFERSESARHTRAWSCPKYVPFARHCRLPTILRATCTHGPFRKSARTRLSRSFVTRQKILNPELVLVVIRITRDMRARNQWNNLTGAKNLWNKHPEVQSSTLCKSKRCKLTSHVDRQRILLKIISVIIELVADEV